MSKILKLPHLSLKKRTYWHSVTRNKERIWTKVGMVDDPLDTLLDKYNEIMADNAERKDRLQPLARAWLAYRLKEVEDGLLAQKTWNEYRKMLAPHARLTKVFGNRHLDSIKPYEIQDYLDSGKRYQANREIACLSAMLGWGRNRGHIENNPTIGVKRNSEKGRTRYVTDDEYRAVYHSQPQSIQNLMDIMFLTGLRVGDVLNLRFADCDDEWITVNESKTGKQVRFIWTEELLEAVERSRKTQPIGEYVVRREDGKPYKHRHLAKVFRDNFPGEIESFMLKDLRAKHATDRDDPVMASYALGHSSSAITQKHYLRSARGRLVSPLGKKLA